MGASIQVPPALLLIQTLADVPGKAEKMAQVVGPLTPVWEIQVGFLTWLQPDSAPTFAATGKVNQRIEALSPYPSFFQIKEIIIHT